MVNNVRAEEAAGHPLPSEAGSLSQSAASLNLAMRHMQAGSGTWQTWQKRRHSTRCPDLQSAAGGR